MTSFNTIKSNLHSELVSNRSAARGMEEAPPHGLHDECSPLRLHATRRKLVRPLVARVASQHKERPALEFDVSSAATLPRHSQHPNALQREAQDGLSEDERGVNVGAQGAIPMRTDAVALDERRGVVDAHPSERAADRRPEHLFCIIDHGDRRPGQARTSAPAGIDQPRAQRTAIRAPIG